MRVGIVGLGRMGSGIAARLRARGVETLGYDGESGRSEVRSLRELVRRLDERPRIVWTFVPPGAATGEVVEELVRFLDPGDVVVDGGNADFRDSVWRAAKLSASSIGFVDVGISGGIQDETDGYCLVVGGERDTVEQIRPVLEVLAAKGGVAHVGPVGAGHFTNMVHNGVEYGLIEAYAEGYELLTAADLDIDVRAAIEVWRHASTVRSSLLDLLAGAIAHDPSLERVLDYPADSGQDRWTVREAVRLGVPAAAITAALYARFTARRSDSPAMKVVAVLRERFAGHEARPAP